jgi:hypothetical protein
MDDLERALASALRRHRTVPADAMPPAPAPWDSSQVRRARPHRTAILSAAACACLLALAAAAYAHARHGQDEQGTLAGQQPTSPTASPIATPTVTPTAAPAVRRCRQDDLLMSLSDAGGAAGQTVQVLTVTNTSKGECVLPVYPTLIAEGHTVPVGREPDITGAAPKSDVKPGHTAIVNFVQPSTCAPAGAMRVVIADGERTLGESTGFLLNVRCALYSGPFSEPANTG